MPKADKLYHTVYSLQDMWSMEANEMPKPAGYVELVLDIAVVCTNHVSRKQAVILRNKVGSEEMYCVYGGRFIMRYPDVDAPPLSHTLVTTEFFGKALKVARAWCGWDWESHPDKPEDMP